MTCLSVNINKIATLRNARGKNTPNLLQFTRRLLELGIASITVHPRPDQRHITRQDVYHIAALLARQTTKNIEFNIEGYPSADFLALVNEIKPTQCTLVPDPPEALTSNAGWKLFGEEQFLNSIRALIPAQTRISLFMDPFDYRGEEKCLAALLASAKIDRVELYTEAYADGFGGPEQAALLQVYRQFAEACVQAGLKINAGHDLTSENLPALLDALPCLAEVSIGHALLSDALYWGIEETIRRYTKCLQ